MATSNNKPIDLAETGPLGFRQLQKANEQNQTGEIPDMSEHFAKWGINENDTSLYDPLQHAQQDVSNPFGGQETRLGNQDYWGNSAFDAEIANEEQFSRLGDIRAENQPWYSKLLNGIAKAGVLAGTTALETAGLLYGAGHSMLEAAGALDDNGKSWLQDLWDNPITNALQNINEASEEYMPNYYTRDEQENPFGNIFTANFLGDKLLKNLGFMVGAFYGGMPAASGLGKLGQVAVKGARNRALAGMQGAARRFGEIAADYSDDVLGNVGRYGREIQGLSEDAVKGIGSKYGDDVVNAYSRLASEGLTEGERGKKLLEGLDKVRDIAQTTRAVTQTIGSLGSAINEGAIEALNNSKDWARLAAQKEDVRYQTELEEELGRIDAVLGGTEAAEAIKAQKMQELSEKHQSVLAEIEKGRARMGNADLLLNIPVLMASNMYQLGKLYTRGFDSTRRQMGSLWNGHKLSGDLAEGTLKSDKTWKGALGTALLKSNTEGLEEYLQRAASDGAGEAVDRSIERWLNAGTSKEATNNTEDFLAGFGKAVADNLGDPSAWEEYMIGAVSSMVGMPVFGSQTKNAYIGKDSGVFGFAGGVVGNYQDYMSAKQNEESVANYLNGRVKDPKFRALYDNLKRQDDYDRWLQDEIEKGDKSEYKDLELEKFYQDINAAASSGHLEEFKQLVGYNTDYSDQELEDIVKQTTRKISPEVQKKQDEDRKVYLEEEKNIRESARERMGYLPANETKELKNISDELDSVNQRLEEDNYQEKLEGPFIDVNGQMNVTNPEKMVEILNRNRENLLQGIDDYLKIRNDIDIETDGRLDDNQIALLTQMKGKILSYERRSAEMADDLVNNLGDVLANQEDWRNRINTDVEKAQEKYNQAKQNWDKVKNDKHSKEHKVAVEKKFLDAEKKLNKAKAAQSSVGNVIKLLELLTEEKQTTAGERAAYAKGRGEGIIGRTDARLDVGKKRAINSDEAQAILSHPQNAITLVSTVNSRTSGLDDNVRRRLSQEIVDLSTLANNKVAYNNKIREFLGDPAKINEAYQQAQDKLSQKDIDNKSDELALNIQNARSMSELDRIIREARAVNSEVAKKAMDKAKQNADENTKNFIADYEKATKFYGDFSGQAQKLASEVAPGVFETAASEWEHALQDGIDVYDKFVEGLHLAADELEKSGVPGGKETADAMKKILKDLNAANRSTATNSKPKSGTSTSVKKDVEDGGPESVSGEGAGLAGLNKKMAEKRAKVVEEKKEEPASAEVQSKDTQASLQKAVEQEVRANRKKDSQEKLSKELKDRIQKYNEENPDSPFTVSFEQIFQQITDEEIANDGTNLDEDDFEDDGTDFGDSYSGSQRAEDMRNNLKVTFRSDNPTQFRIFNGDVFTDYRELYEPTVEELMENNPKLTKRQAQQLKDRIDTLRNFLEQYKAYQFVDKNYLGYVKRALQDKDESLEVHFVRSTDDVINSDSTHPVTFLAIKWNDDAENAIRRFGFNNRKDANLSDEVKPVTINGEQYHIVGVLTINGDITQEVSDAFASLQGALNKELNPQMDTAKQNGEQFVISEKTSTVDSIFTGRLEKRDNNEEEDGTKIGLYDLMTDQQGDPERRTSTEWIYGSEFYFGTIVNGEVSTVEDDKLLDRMEPINSTLAEANNGAIMVYVPKADGQLYPIRCSRRTVREWLDSPDADGGRTGRQLLNALLYPDPEHPVKNEYLGNILNYLKNVYDEEATLSDKMNAKTMLQKYFIFGKESPIHFNEGEVMLTFDEDEFNITSDTFEEFAEAFFNALGEADIMFTLPSPTIEYVSGREVIKSGIFEVGLRGFYNFNANFTIKPIDGDGNEVIVSDVAESDNEHFTGSANMRGGIREYDLGDGVKSYMLRPDGTFTLNGVPVDAATQDKLTVAEKARLGGHPSYKEYFLSQLYDNPEIIKYVSDGLFGFDGIYIINDNPEDPWIYDSRKGEHNLRLYRLNEPDSEDGKKSRGHKLKDSTNEAKNKFIQKPANLQEILKLKKNAEGSPEDTVSERVSQVVQTLAGILGSKMGNKKAESLTKALEEIDPSLSDDQLDEAIEEAFRGNRLTKYWYNLDAYKDKGVSRNSLMMAVRSNASKVVLPEAPVRKPSTPSENVPQAGKKFAGKILNQLNPKNGGLEALIANNSSNLSVKKIFEALQGAEDAGIPVDYKQVEIDLEALLKADRAKVKELRDALLHKIQGC